MVWIPGGTFRVGSDSHYPEERPEHRVTVDGFCMDRYQDCIGPSRIGTLCAAGLCRARIDA